MTHPYFTDQARQVFTRAKGNPDNADALAAWAEKMRVTYRDEHNDAGPFILQGVILAADGQVLARTKASLGRVTTYYALGDDLRVHDATEFAGKGLVVDLACSRLTYVTGQPTIHVTMSDVCFGAGKGKVGAHA